jgi:hypothetical protein
MTDQEFLEKLTRCGWLNRKRMLYGDWLEPRPVMPEPLHYVDEIASFTEEDFYRVLNRKRIPIFVDPTLPDDTIRIEDSYLTGIKVVEE